MNVPYKYWQCCRLHLKCDGTRAETRFLLLAKRTSPFKSTGGHQFIRLLAAEVCASAVVTLDTPASKVVQRVLATHSIRQFPLHLPFPCVTVCCHISTGHYHTTFEFHSVPWYIAHVQVHVLSKQWYGDLLATLYISTNAVPSQKHTHLTVYDDSSLHVAVHCPAGTFAGEKQQQCTRCPRGFYQNRDRQGSCIRCPMGTYTREEGTSSYTVLYAPVTLLFFNQTPDWTFLPTGLWGYVVWWIYTFVSRFVLNTATCRLWCLRSLMAVF